MNINYDLESMVLTVTIDDEVIELDFDIGTPFYLDGEFSVNPDFTGISLKRRIAIMSNIPYADILADYSEAKYEQIHYGE